MFNLIDVSHVAGELTRKVGAWILPLGGRDNPSNYVGVHDPTASTRSIAPCVSVSRRSEACASAMDHLPSCDALAAPLEVVAAARALLPLARSSRAACCLSSEKGNWGTAIIDRSALELP